MKGIAKAFAGFWTDLLERGKVTFDDGKTKLSELEMSDGTMIYVKETNCSNHVSVPKDTVIAAVDPCSYKVCSMCFREFFSDSSADICVSCMKHMQGASDE